MQLLWYEQMQILQRNYVYNSPYCCLFCNSNFHTCYLNLNSLTYVCTNLI